LRHAVQIPVEKSSTLGAELHLCSLSSRNIVNITHYSVIIYRMIMAGRKIYFKYLFVCLFFCFLGLTALLVVFSTAPVAGFSLLILEVS
jgi:hypothetical protein